MTFPILPSNGASEAFSIANSVRVNSGDSPSMTRTPGSAGNRRTFTLSTWFKLSKLSGERVLYNTDDGTGSNNNFDYVAINASHKLFLYNYVGSEGYNLISNQVFRDPSAWYHLVIAFDTTQSTSSDRIKVYLNGNQITSWATSNYPSQNFDTKYNNTEPQGLFKYPDQSQSYYDGYVCETVMVDGTALDATSFGEFTDEGVWTPIDVSGLTFGTNGYHLKYSNSADFGEDSSGNNNDFTASNFASTDQTTDTCTNNFATWNINDFHNGFQPTYSEGATKAVGANSGRSFCSSIGVSSGKWYVEAKWTDVNAQYLGFVPQNYITSRPTQDAAANSISIQGSNPTLYKDGSSAGSLAGTVSDNDIIMFALDLDNSRLYIGKNGNWNDGIGGGFDQSDFSNATGHTFTKLTDANYVIASANGSSGEGYTVELNTGNPSFSISSGNSDGNGFGNFEYAPPSDYLAWCVKNITTAEVDNGKEYFNTVLYTGTGNENAITGVGFQPDWVWLKRRDANLSSHRLYDAVRGATKEIFSDNGNNETTVAQSLKSFDSDGFTMGTDAATNGLNRSFVSWCWHLGGSSSSNTDGDITNTLLVNQSAGISIGKYTGNGNASSQTVGHGLGKTPKVVTVKMLTDTGQSWRTWFDPVNSSDNGNFNLNGTGETSSSDPALVTGVSSTTFTLKAYTSPFNAVNASGKEYLNISFAEIEGFSKFGTYTGNGNANGTFVYTGFRPAWLMIKRYDGTNNWNMFDSKRDTFNQVGKVLYANLSDEEGADPVHSSANDFLSNGFKLRETGNAINGSGASYIYLAFAENPFSSSAGVPVTAR